MGLINKNIIFYIFILLTLNINAKPVEQYFIKIIPNESNVQLGRLEVTKLKTNLNFFNVEVCTPAKSLELINDSILKNYPKDKKVLFFVHGFWGSLSFATHRTAKVFKANYFNKENSDVVAIIHLIWSANDIYYKQTLKDLENSTNTLANIFNSIENNIDFQYSLMCHSMGNRFLHETLISEDIKVFFKQLLLIAPDLDYRKYEKNSSVFSELAESVDVFYHKNDKTLKMSKGINKIERLGRLNKANEKINFIDCTNIKDIDTLSDSVMKHLYFLTSRTVKNQIEKILNQ